MDNRKVAKANLSFEVNILHPEAIENPRTLSNLEHDLNFKFSSATWYLDWSDDFTSEIAGGFQSVGALPTLAWQPQIGSTGIQYSQVTDGSYDTYLNSFADAVKSYGGPIRISLAPEMNAEWTPWGVGNSGDPEAFKAFWRYTVSKFQSRGVSNVSWIWAPNIHHWGEKYSFGELYPGDDFVDFTGLDGYNWGTSQSWGSWQSFNEIFGSSYNDLVNLSGKKILITELASTETGGSKAQWISDMFSTISTNFSQVAGIYWFNFNKETDWRINSSTASFNAFKAGLSGINYVDTAGESTSDVEQSSRDGEQAPSSIDSQDSPVDSQTTKTPEANTANNEIQKEQFSKEQLTYILPKAKTTFYNQKTAKTIPGKILGVLITASDSNWEIDKFISVETQLLVVSIIALVSLGSCLILVLRD